MMNSTTTELASYLRNAIHLLVIKNTLLAESTSLPWCPENELLERRIFVRLRQELSNN